MGFHVKNIPYEHAISTVSDYEFALLYNLSSVKLCRTAELTEADWEECVEARLFRRDAELHLFPLYEKRALSVSEIDDEDTIESVYYLSKQFRKIGKTKLIVKRYLRPDADGQMCIELTRLAGLE